MEKTEFEPKQWVLVRDANNEMWKLDIFSNFKNTALAGCFYCVGGWFKQCIPYEGNESLRGTTDEYKGPWTPKDGDFVVIGRYENIIAIYRASGAEPIAAYAAYNTLHSSLYKDNELEGFVELIRPAAEEEKNYLLNKMREAGQNWDAVNKKIKAVKRIPHEGETFYYPEFNYQIGGFGVVSGYWDEHFADWIREHASCTTEECQAECAKLNSRIRSKDKEELGGIDGNGDNR